MRVSFELWIAAFLVGVLALPGVANAWDPSSSLIRFNGSKGCLAAEGDTVRLRPCNSNDTRQRWAYTASKELRSPRYKNKCVDVDKRRLTNGTRLRLYECRGFATQRWSFTNTLLDVGLIQTASGKCIDLPAGNRTSGTRFIIWSCSRRNKNQQFKTSGSVRRVVNSKRADNLGFDRYRQCDGRDAKSCYMTFTVFTGYRFGYYTGGGHGDRSWNRPTLDFGDPFSVDYCAKIHDYMYSVDFSKRGIRAADTALVDCSKRVRPVTFEESEAKKNVKMIFKIATGGSVHQWANAAEGRDYTSRVWNRARLAIDCFEHYNGQARRNDTCSALVREYDGMDQAYSKRHEILLRRIQTS